MYSAEITFAVNIVLTLAYCAQNLTVGASLRNGTCDLLKISQNEYFSQHYSALFHAVACEALDSIKSFCCCCRKSLLSLQSASFHLSRLEHSKIFLAMTVIFRDLTSVLSSMRSGGAAAADLFAEKICTPSVLIIIRIHRAVIDDFERISVVNVGNS